LPNHFGSFLKNCPKENNCPTGENSPNLVTLAATNSSTFLEVKNNFAFSQGDQMNLKKIAQNLAQPVFL
jgi:hypothetical protein